jgi:DnaJ-class molecular chaperone
VEIAVIENLCKCHDCKGHGWVPVDVYTRAGVWYATSTCPACNGTGRVSDKVREVRNG